MVLHFLLLLFTTVYLFVNVCMRLMPVSNTNHGRRDFKTIVGQGHTTHKVSVRAIFCYPLVVVIAAGTSFFNNILVSLSLAFGQPREIRFGLIQPA